MIETELDAATMISVFRLIVSTKTPFFTVLSFNCKFIGVTGDVIETAGTDGRNIYFNVERFNKYTNAERTAVFVHELLHVAYGHVSRCKHRDKFLWNIACDVYCNTIIQELDFCKLPEGAVNEPNYWRETSEEIYELLKQNPEVVEKYQQQSVSLSDLFERSTFVDEEGNPIPAPSKDELERLAKEWEDRLEVAHQEQLNKGKNQGNFPEKLARTLGAIKEPQIDWRQALLNYLVKSPNDYQGFDRRFISQGLYNDTLDGSTVRVDVCIDTSGSIGERELAVFASELNGILSSYPEVMCDLYWADASAYGPYPMSNIGQLPSPEGGGGTCFRDFFIKSQSQSDRELATIAVYLTDGYGSFPEEEPAGLDTLWIVTPDGLSLKKFPFGLAVKLQS